MNIRSATPLDAAALVELYAPYVLHTAITFEYEVPSVAEFAERIADISRRYPYLVAEENARILGYAYASAFKARAAYGWSVEMSVYVEKDAWGRGIGKALYAALESCLKRQNVCNLCACITYPNPSSIAFHESLGYSTVGRFTASGYKLGRWHDIIWMEKFIHTHEETPKPFIPIEQL